MSSAERTRVILADDHNLVRSGMAALLKQHGGFDVVAEATDGVVARGVDAEVSSQLPPKPSLLPGPQPDSNPPYSPPFPPSSRT